MISRKHVDDAIAGRPPSCPYCDEPAELIIDSTSLYGRDFGPVWACRSCDARVGVHPGTTRALGTLANQATRRARNAAHAVFDPLWKSGQIKRRAAYAKLASLLGLPVEETHISFFGPEQCERVVDALVDLSCEESPSLT